jgi:hypothetical protein
VINILNADGGRGLMEEYIGMESGGNGNLLHVGFQYDFSLQKYLKYPTYFNALDWDFTGNIFATYVHVNSDQESTNEPGFEVQIDDVDKLKMGTELTYMPWKVFGFSARYDYVAPNLADSGRSFQFISPKLVFRTDFLAHELVTLRYTRWFYSNKERTLIQTVAPNDPQGLDEHMVALQGSIWW